MNIIAEIHNGQSLLPPDRKGLTAGNSYWLKVFGSWYKIEISSVIGEIKKLRDKGVLRKWPGDFK